MEQGEKYMQAAKAIAFTELLVPDEVAADIRAKLVVILVSLHHLTQEILEM